MNLGLVMGGGGLVGIAWELGVLAGLQEAAGSIPTSAAVIVGSSAGSVSGAQAALGKDLRALADRQLRPHRRGEARRPVRGDRARIPQGILEVMMSATGTDRRASGGGRQAGDGGRRPDDENDYVESFRASSAPTRGPTSICASARPKPRRAAACCGSRDDGIDLVRAVASSCAIPGFFPPVRFGDKHYVDGPRGGYMAPLVKRRRWTASSSSVRTRVAAAVRTPSRTRGTRRRGHAGRDDHGRRVSSISA